MKALRASVLVLSRFVLSVVLLGLWLHVRAGGAGPAVAGENGDVNGDRRLDISDPVYILRFLFSDGPAPVACADSPELVGRVSALEGKVETLGTIGTAPPNTARQIASSTTATARRRTHARG